MVKLSKPADGSHGSQGSLRDKFPVLSSITEQTVSHSATTSTKTRQSSHGFNHVENSATQIKPLNRSKSLFSLAQSFFKLKVDNHPDSTFTADGFTRPQPVRQPSVDSSSATGFHQRNPRGGDEETEKMPPKQYGTWNPLVSIRGKFDGSFFGGRGRSGPAVPGPAEFHADVGSPIKRRKSLHGLQDAWGTVGKKFTLRGRKRGQAEAALSAYRLDTYEGIELPTLGREVFGHESDSTTEPLPSKGLPTSVRVSSADQDNIALQNRAERHGEPTMKDLTIPNYTNRKAQSTEGRTNDVSSTSSKTIGPVRTHSGNKHVAFASVTQLKLKEEAIERQRVKSHGSDASGCPSLGSASVSEKELLLPDPSVQLEKIFSTRTSMDQMAEKSLADEQAELDLIEKLFDESASFRSVDLDVFHENRRNLRQARYNMLMDPVQQVENFEIFTQVVENTKRMLLNIGHGDVEVLSACSSFTGPLYTWSVDQTVLDACERPEVHPVLDFDREEGDGNVYYYASGVPMMELHDHYNESIVTVKEVSPDLEETAAANALQDTSALKLDSGSFSDFCRGRRLWPTPTKNLAVNNRASSRSPLKRFDVDLAPNTAFHRMMENETPSSTVAVRCPSADRARGKEASDAYAAAEPDWTNFDISILSLTNKGNATPIRGGAHSCVSPELQAFQDAEAANFRREHNISDSPTEYISTTAGSPAQSSVSDGLLSPAFTPLSADARPSSSSGKAKNFEELELELLAFQAEEEAKFKKDKARAIKRQQTRERSDSSDDSAWERCCQYWRNCDKVGTCFEEQEKASKTLSYRREWRAEYGHNSEFKKRHWVDVNSCTENVSTTGENTTTGGRDTSFTFIAHGKKIRMATYGDSSFFAKTSDTRATGCEWKSMGQQQPMRKGNGKRPSFDNEDDFVIDETIVASHSDDTNHRDCKYAKFDDEFHPDSMLTFTFEPKGFTTANPSSSSSSSSGCISPKTFNNYGNIVLAWPSPDLQRDDASNKAASSYHVENIDVRPRVGTARISDMLEWPLVTQDFLFRAHYPLNLPAPRSPDQQQGRNLDSGYWDSEKQAIIGSAPVSSSSSSESEDDFDNAPPLANSPHDMAAHVLSSSADPKVTRDLERLVELEYAKRYSMSMEVNDIASVSPPASLTAGKRADKGKGKAPALPERPDGPSHHWRGKSQEWPIVPTFPTFIALEPATSVPKDKGKEKVPTETKRKVTPSLCIHTRNITPQKRINGKGPVSPLTKAWLESKKQSQRIASGNGVDSSENSFNVVDASLFEKYDGGELRSALGNSASGNRVLRHFYANVTGDGKAVSIPPIRSMRGEAMRPSLVGMDRTASGVSVVTLVDESFGEELVDFRGVEGKETERGHEIGEVDEGVSRVPSWMLYG